MYQDHQTGVVLIGIVGTCFAFGAAVCVCVVCCSFLRDLCLGCCCCFRRSRVVDWKKDMASSLARSDRSTSAGSLARRSSSDTPSCCASSLLQVPSLESPSCCASSLLQVPSLESSSTSINQEQQQRRVPLPYLDEQPAEHEDLEKGCSQEPVQETEDATSLRRTPLPYFQEPESAHEVAEIQPEKQDERGVGDDSFCKTSLPCITEVEDLHEAQEQAAEEAEEKDDVTSLRQAPCPYLQDADDLEQGGSGKHDVGSLTPRSRALPYLIN